MILARIRRCAGPAAGAAQAKPEASKLMRREVLTDVSNIRIFSIKY